MGQLSSATKQLRQDLTLIGLGQGFERLQEVARGVSHGETILRPFQLFKSLSQQQGPHRHAQAP